jgi:hypothetical protein
MKRIYEQSISLAILAIIILSAQGCVFPKDSSGKPLSPSELRKAAEFMRPIGGFESLRFGMTEDEAMKHLPKGFKAEDLPLTWEPEGAEIHFIYGDKVPPTRWGAIKRFHFGPADKMDFVLGFTKDGLGFVMLILPAKAVNDRVFDGILQGIKRMVGSEIEQEEMPPGSSFKAWWMTRIDGEIQLTRPLDDEGYVNLMFMTHGAGLKYSDLMSKTESIPPGE